VLSPLKSTISEERDRGKGAAANTSRDLFQAKRDDDQVKRWKRKSKGSESSLTPDLNLPVIDTSALVPTGLVMSKVQEIAKNVDGAALSALEELMKKQKRSSKNKMQGWRRLRAAAPAEHNESLEFELPGLGAARGSSRSP
jgi:hypothetical protein